MGSFEGHIGEAAYERVSEAAKPKGKPLLRRVEDFAVDNIKALAAGASACVLVLAAALSLPAGRPSGDDADWRQADLAPLHTSSVAGQVRVPSLPEWQPIRRPVEIIALQAPQFDRNAAQYAARRNAREDREDALVWQPQTPGGAEARIAVVRSASQWIPPSLFVDMTRQQAERGIAVTRSGVVGRLETKFGLLEVADMTFSDASGAAQACLAFRSAADGGSPSLTGWYCAAQGAVVERPELACFIDRLSLLKSGEDHALRRFFTEAEQRRKPCPTTRMSTGRKPTWLDQDGRAPPIRGAEDVTGSIARPNR